MPHFNRPARMELRGTQMCITRRFIGHQVRWNNVDLQTISAASFRRLKRLFEADIWTRVEYADKKEYQMLGRMGVTDYTYLNDNGVECMSKAGGGDLPVCCAKCPIYEPAEYDDSGFGGLWATGYCRRGLFLPTRIGICQVKERYLQLPTRQEPPYLGRQGAKE